jgi:hypothetical protein
MSEPTDLPPPALQAVGTAIQNLAAARLGRAFVPLALLFLVGVGEMLTGARGLALAAGAPLTAGAMLLYGLRVVQRAFGRAERRWMVLVPAAGILPLGLGLYVLGWRGLRALTALDGLPGMVGGVFFTLMGAWLLRVWVKLLELGRLADTMVVGDETGEGG